MRGGATAPYKSRPNRLPRRTVSDCNRESLGVGWVEEAGAGSGHWAEPAVEAMDLLRTIAYQPGSTGAAGGGNGKMGEQALGKACSGESRRKKATAADPEQHHHHSHSAAEVSRIIIDPTTGRRYCRGKVLGKVKTPGGVAGGGGCWAWMWICRAEPGAKRSSRRPPPCMLPLGALSPLRLFLPCFVSPAPVVSFRNAPDLLYAQISPLPTHKASHCAHSFLILQWSGCDSPCPPRALFCLLLGSLDSSVPGCLPASKSSLLSLELLVWKGLLSRSRGCA